MASLTGGFAPIAGAGAKNKGGLARKTDLTGGLILLSAGGSSNSTRSKHEDVDFGDFDVDDLLLDDGGAKGLQKLQSKSPPKKKKSASSSKKKEKDKKKSSTFTQDGKDDDWDKDDEDVKPKGKATKSGFDPTDFIPIKKNSHLDDEFARMLGLDDELTDLAAVSGLAGDDDVSGFEDSPVRRAAYAPSTRPDLAPPQENSPSKAEEPAPVADVSTGGGGGLDASFFQDEQTAATRDLDFGSLSFLSSSDKRGARGCPRRQGGGGGGASDGTKPQFADPFEKNNTSRHVSGLDDLFGPSMSRGPAPATARQEPLDAAPTAAPKSSFASLFGGNDVNGRGRLANESASSAPAARSLATSSKTQPASAKDDLLAELFPSEPVVTKKSSPPRATPVVKLADVQQDDLLADLFPVDPRRSSPSEPVADPPSLPSQSATNASAPKVTTASTLEPPRSPKTQRRTEKSPPSENTAAPSVQVDSARDSLLKDLFPESPQRSWRTARTIEETEEAVAAEQKSDEAAPPSVAQPSPPPPQTTARVLSPVRKASPAKPASKSPSPSPGKTKTLTIGTPSKAREVEFEQAKDDLLEEIFASAPSSPLKSPKKDATGFESASPRSRRGSYSLSFDQDQLANDPPPPIAVVLRQHIGRSPERQEISSFAATTAVPAPTPAPTVFLRNVHAEDELKRVHAADVATLQAQHALALQQRDADKQQLQAQLESEQSKMRIQTTACEAHTLQLQQLQEQLAVSRTELGQLLGSFQSLQTQHALQQTQCELFDRERAALLSQLKSADDQQRALVQQLGQEKLAHQHAQLKLANFKRETDQRAELQSEKERAQMDRLYHQLQNSLVQLTMLQEQSSEDTTAKRELEAASRFRMITSLESTSRGYAQQTQDECHRLTSLLANLETTLRAYRQEHLEEKERLRQEQLRLNVLSQHFQAQTNVLHEKSDANAQLLAQYLSSSLQDVRVAEARLATRRQQLAEDEQALYSERAAFASHREEWLEQRQRESAELEAGRAALEREWRAVQRERDDVDDVIASHDDAFRALQQQRHALDAEKERVAVGALHVAEMAGKFERLTKQLVDKEHAMRQQHETSEELRRQWAAREHSVESERRKLDEREARLHAQLKQMETARRKMIDERKQQLQHMQQQRQHVCRASDDVANYGAAVPIGAVRSHGKLASSSSSENGARATTTANAFFRTALASPLPQPQHSDSLHSKSVDVNRSKWTHPSPEPPSNRADPSGFTPLFRQLVEDNWQKQERRRTEAEMLRERMAIHCIGLDTTSHSRVSSDRSMHVSQQQPASISVTPTTTKTTSTGSALPHGPPPPPSQPSGRLLSPSTPSAAPARVLSVHL